MKREYFGSDGDYGPNSMRIHFQARVLKHFEALKAAIVALNPDAVAAVMNEISEGYVLWDCRPSIVMDHDYKVRLPELPGEYAVTRWVTDALVFAAEEQAARHARNKRLSRRDQMFPGDPVPASGARLAVVRKGSGWRPRCPWLIMKRSTNKCFAGLDAVYFGDWPRITASLCLGRIDETVLYVKYGNAQSVDAWAVKRCQADAETLFDYMLCSA